MRFTGSTVEAALKSGLKELNLQEQEVTWLVVEDAKKGFLGLGKKEAVVEITPIPKATNTSVKEQTCDEFDTQDIAEQIIEEKEELLTPVFEVKEHLPEKVALTELSVYLTDITKELNLPALVRIEHQEDCIIVHLDTDKPQLLIGKHGKIVNALQYLAQVYIHRICDEYLSIIVNVSDYREKRNAILERLAKRTAKEAKETKQPVFLEPMPAFERKIIHGLLTNDPKIKTHSEGKEPYRYLVVEATK